eukprot:s1489_g8.t1
MPRFMAQGFRTEQKGVAKLAELLQFKELQSGAEWYGRQWLENGLVLLKEYEARCFGRSCLICAVSCVTAQDSFVFRLLSPLLLLPMRELQSGAVADGRKWLEGALNLLNEDQVQRIAALLPLSFARGDALKVMRKKLLQKMWLEESLRVAEYSLQESVHRLCKNAKGPEWLKDALSDEVAVLTRWAARNKKEWLKQAVCGLSRSNLAAVCKAFGTDQPQVGSKTKVRENRDGLDTKKLTGFDAELQNLRQVVSDNGRAGLLLAFQAMKQNVLRGVGRAAGLDINPGGAKNYLQDNENDDAAMDLAKLGKILTEGSEDRLRRALEEVHGERLLELGREAEVGVYDKRQNIPRAESTIRDKLVQEELKELCRVASEEDPDGVLRVLHGKSADVLRGLGSAAKAEVKYPGTSNYYSKDVIVENVANFIAPQASEKRQKFDATELPPTRVGTVFCGY